MSTAAALDFPDCRRRLERTVAEACEPCAEWRGAVAAAVAAALEFAAADPAAALTLSGRATARWKRRDPGFVAMVERFAALLSRGAPPHNPRLPEAHVVVLCIARQISVRVEAGRAAELPGLAPDLAFLALLPFVGFAEARRGAPQDAQDTATA